MPEVKLPPVSTVELSTAHILYPDTVMLDRLAERQTDNKSTPLSVTKYPEGYYITLPNKDHWGWVFPDCKYAGLSEALLNILTLCVHQDIRLLVLDRDAPDVDGLPKFDW